MKHRRLNLVETGMLVALSMSVRVEFTVEAYGPFSELEEKGLANFVADCHGHTLHMAGERRSIELTPLGREVAQSVERILCGAIVGTKGGFSFSFGT